MWLRHPSPSKLKSAVVKKYTCHYTDTSMMDGIYHTPSGSTPALFQNCASWPLRRDSATTTRFEKIRGDVDAALEGFERPASWMYRDDGSLTWYSTRLLRYPVVGCYDSKRLMPAFSDRKCWWCGLTSQSLGGFGTRTRGSVSGFGGAFSVSFSV